MYPWYKIVWNFVVLGWYLLLLNACFAALGLAVLGGQVGWWGALWGVGLGWVGLVALIIRMEYEDSQKWQ